jgi:hypothetical protein
VSREAKQAELVDLALLAAGTTGERQVWFTRPEAAAAIRKTLTDAETVYTKRAKEWRDYGEGMHQRAMRAEAVLRDLEAAATAAVHAKTAGAEQVALMGLAEPASRARALLNR